MNPSHDPESGRDGDECRELLEREAADLDALAGVSGEVLAGRVSDLGRCLWEITDGDPPLHDLDGAGDPDRELAVRLCAGCPVRRECLELELRTAGELTVGVWGGLGEDDRRVLHAVWRARAIRHQQHDTDHHDTDEQEGEQS